MRQWIHGICIIAVSRPAEFAGSANSLNFRLIYTTTSSCMSHRYIKFTVKTEAHVLLLPPNQLLYFISPSQHHHSSSCSNQKQIHPGLLPLLIFSHQFCLLLGFYIFILYFSNLGPKLLQLFYISSSSLTSMLLFLWPCYNRSNDLYWMLVKIFSPAENTLSLLRFYLFFKVTIWRGN